jgi:Tfp pilus assembly protein PilF
VRIEAARVLVDLPQQRFAAEDRQAFTEAFAELKEALQADSDMPTGQLNLAGIHAQQGQESLAEAVYLRALSMDP